MPNHLMNFHKYVTGLNNNVDENTACKKYKDHMANLTQSRVGRFFDANKDREWFRLKYHPSESRKTVHRQNVNFLKRLRIFNDLSERNFFDNLPYCMTHHRQILNLCDAVQVILEDGPQSLVDQLLSGDENSVDQNLRSECIPNKPTSLVIDDIGIETTISEIEELCKKAHPSLKRIAQPDPYYVKGGTLRRKFIAVYDSKVDVKDVCWKLSRTKLNNKLLSVRINSRLTNRVLPVSATTNHQISVVNDIRNAIILILNFDKMRGVYGKRKQFLEDSSNHMSGGDVHMGDPVEDQDDESSENVAPPSPPGSETAVKNEEEDKSIDINTFDEEKEKEKRKIFEFKFNIELSLYRQISKLLKNNNSILEGAATYLLDYTESAAANYHLSKVPKELLGDCDIESFEKSLTDNYSRIELVVKNRSLPPETSVKFLDKLLWYLRIVHSFDYYNKAVYRHEDDLTFKMGLIHVRDDPSKFNDIDNIESVKNHLTKADKEFRDFGLSQTQRFITKDEERFNYKSYGKVITDELTSYAQKVQKPKGGETAEVYKCKHCTRVFQKLSDIARHFVGKHKWAVSLIETETDFFNAYLFDYLKISPMPPSDLVDAPPNRFAKVNGVSHVEEDSDPLKQTIEAYKKMDSFVREPAPRDQNESDPRCQAVVDYTDISFDDAI